MAMKRASGENTVHEPVVKSCSRVPIATTTSASPASAFADAAPITPIGPTLFLWSCTSEARPAIVSATGRLCRSAKNISAGSACE